MAGLLILAALRPTASFGSKVASRRWRNAQQDSVQIKKILKRINQLIKDTQRTPFEGIGKPEPLKFDLSGLWSRRINQEHRLIYQVEDECILVVQCRYHY